MSAALLAPPVLLLATAWGAGALLLAAARAVHARSRRTAVPTGAPIGGFALTTLIGACALAALLSNLSVLGVPRLAVLGAAYVLAAAGMVCALRRPGGEPSGPASHGPGGGARAAVPGALTGIWLLALLSSPLLVALTSPPLAYDAMSTWWPKLAEAAAGARPALATTGIAHLHAEYPRGLAWLGAVGAPWGAPDPRWLKLQTLLFTWLAALAVAAALRAAGRAGAGVLAASLLVLVPDVARWSHSGYADLPLAAAVLVAALGLRHRATATGVVAAVAGAVGAASIKQEGAVVLLVVAAQFAWDARRVVGGRPARARLDGRDGTGPRAGRGVLAPLVGLAGLLVVAPWWIARAGAPGEVLAAAGDVLGSPAVLLARLEAVARALGAALADPSALRDTGTEAPVAWAGWAVLACAALVLPRGPRLASTAPAVALALAVVAIYVVTPHDLRWHVRTAFPRLLLTLLPLLLLVAAGRLAGAAAGARAEADDDVPPDDEGPPHGEGLRARAPDPAGASAHAAGARGALLLAAVLAATAAACGDEAAAGRVDSGDAVETVARVGPGDPAAHADPADLADPLAPVDPPNVVLIVADDLGYGDLGCYGGELGVTPRIDALAAQGVRFTDLHATAPVCGPSRLSLLSGRHHLRVDGLVRNEAAMMDEAEYDREMSALLPRLLRDAGYATGFVGKWHLGPPGPSAPTRRGFDSFRGFHSGSVDYVTRISQKGHYDWWHDEESDWVEDGYVTHQITDAALRFVEEHAAERFFLCVSHLAPHKPHQGPGDAPVFAKGESNTWPQQTPPGKYAEVLAELDAGVGALLDALDRLGLAERTLVLFVSDNGAAEEGSNAPLRGGKGSLLEGGHRVPAIARWTGTIAPAAPIDELASLLDVVPTVLAATGARATRPLDGVSLLPRLLAGESRGDRREGAPGDAPGVTPERDAGEAAPDDDAAARLLCWEFVTRQGQTERAVRRGRYKLLVQGDDVALYDVVSDPGEMEDLAGAHRGRVVSLAGAFDRWRAGIDAAEGGAGR